MTARPQLADRTCALSRGIASSRAATMGARVLFKPHFPIALEGGRAMPVQKWVLAISTSALFSMLAGPALADCSALPSWQDLKTALANVVTAGGNGGLGFNM